MKSLHLSSYDLLYSFDFKISLCTTILGAIISASVTNVETFDSYMRTQHFMLYLLFSLQYIHGAYLQHYLDILLLLRYHERAACVSSSHFMLVCAFVVLCQTVSNLLITWLTSQRNYPCYWLLFFVIILDLPARETSFSQAVIFVDNSGADIILGVLPFARELLRRGTTVYLVLFGNVFTICS